jgi:hypothetical protein
MPRRFDLAGRVFLGLEVLRRAGSRGKGSAWLCRCTVCDTQLTVRRDVLGRQASCGCVARADSRDRKTTHGGYGTPEYMAWTSLIQRCTNPNNIKYPLYGERGIRVCDEWASSFAAFLEHIGPRPSLRHSVDRIETNGNYEPGNVRWATLREQNSNRRNVSRHEHDGLSLTIPEWEERTGLPVRERLRHGWEIARAVTEPAQRRVAC